MTGRRAGSLQRGTEECSGSAGNEPHCSACSHGKPVCCSGTGSSRQQRERQGTHQLQGMGGVIKFRMCSLPNFFVCLMALGFFSTVAFKSLANSSLQLHISILWGLNKMKVAVNSVLLQTNGLFFPFLFLPLSPCLPPHPSQIAPFVHFYELKHAHTLAHAGNPAH